MRACPRTPGTCWKSQNQNTEMFSITSVITLPDAEEEVAALIKARDGEQ